MLFWVWKCYDLGTIRYSHSVSLFSMCYQATHVSPSFLCVTVNQMLVLVFCVLLLTHGRFTYTRLTNTQTAIAASIHNSSFSIIYRVVIPIFCVIHSMQSCFPIFCLLQINRAVSPIFCMLQIIYSC